MLLRHTPSRAYRRKGLDRIELWRTWECLFKVLEMKRSDHIIISMLAGLPWRLPLAFFPSSRY